MNRRQFIIRSGAVLAFVGGFPLFESLAQLETVPRAVPDIANKLEKAYVDILYLASLAPSGHNAQPWTIRLLDTQHWLIGTASSRWLPVVDPENREMLISLGAFLENLVMAAGAYGYEVSVNLLSQNSKDEDLLEIKLYKKDEANHFDVEKIKLRRTVRNSLLTDDLSKEDIRFLTANDKAHFIYFPRQSREGQYLAEGTLLANQMQAYQSPAQEELANWVRWSNQEIQQSGNGLTAETMEITGLARWYVKNFYNRQSVLTQRFRAETVKKVQEQVATGSGWLLLTSKDSSLAELIRVGRNLQQMWLTAREKNIAVHPMTQMLEESAIKKDLLTTLGITEDVQLLLRVGYTRDYPLPVSPRMPLHRLIL
ncbi:Acg family FMN-binding oxidoreductase [Sporomusa acidovorans]|uniref:NAD(P)H nitroreductase PigM n=1 Tax=Sporomusa acidovorans (strain ATCC 49682 / DSM 3132 / Mol) TaxID=1123286 RepID=A0ABZ3J7R9_SPOA4|nr:nitroreductase family protein [Sporomusa acidovorans]OZC21277.1 putative NAD(P)H nitroreductase [Sporomusa acidovorans DSM 3132]SDE66779.1 Nitroreductase family protein [Sporomusa acidovorans]